MPTSFLGQGNICRCQGLLRIPYGPASQGAPWQSFCSIVGPSSCHWPRAVSTPIHVLRGVKSDNIPRHRRTHEKTCPDSDTSPAIIKRIDPHCRTSHQALGFSSLRMGCQKPWEQQVTCVYCPPPSHREAILTDREGVISCLVSSPTAGNLLQRSMHTNTVLQAWSVPHTYCAVSSRRPGRLRKEDAISCRVSAGRLK